jgi:hypothetical protein
MFVLSLMLALAVDPLVNGIPVQLAGSPLQIDRAASRWVVGFDYAKGRADSVTYEDCATFVNRSTSTVTHAQVIFAAADGDGNLRRRSLPFDVRYTLKPGEASPKFIRCLPNGYGNGERGLWLIAWVNEVDFADGTSWHAPPENDVLPQIVSTLRTYNATH